MIGPTIIESQSNDKPKPIFYSKACRQLGIPSEFSDHDGKIKVRLPVMPRETFNAIEERAIFLSVRESKGLPMEQLPSGKWPDSYDEFADQVFLVIKKDVESKSVYIDFGRSVCSVGVSPAMARTIATLIVAAANDLDPDGNLMKSYPELVNVVRVKADEVTEGIIEQEGIISLPTVFDDIGVGGQQPIPNLELGRGLK